MVAKVITGDGDRKKELHKKLEFIIEVGHEPAIRRIEELFERLIDDPSGRFPKRRKRFRGTT